MPRPPQIPQRKKSTPKVAKTQSAVDKATQLFQQGFALHQQGKLSEAKAVYEKVLSINPKHFDTLNMAGAVEAELGKFEAAVDFVSRAIEINPNNASCYNNRGGALLELQQPEAALASVDKAIQLKSDFAEAYSNRGNVLMQLKRPEDALGSYEKAIKLKPEFVDAYLGKSLALLLRGAIASGFQLYEWRWKYKDTGLIFPDYPQPLWLGDEPLAGKTILLHSEQGLGDTLQFCRYAQQVKALGANVLLTTPRTLMPLMQQFPWVNHVLEPGQALPDFDYHCPLLSLPLAFKTDLATIPSPSAYLCSDPAKVQHWARIMGDKTKPRVGLVWSGSASHKGDHKRSMRLESFIALLPQGLEYICLQNELRDTDRTVLKDSSIRYFGADIADYSDTAALCELMDVVVSVDTSVAHLSGALGKATWVLLPYIPDWRWLLDRHDSPWYNCVRLYRQDESRTWDSVLDQVAGDLRTLAGVLEGSMPAGSDNLRQLFQQGFTLHQQGKLSEAKVVYESILKINDTHFDALKMIGAVELQLGKFDAAVNFISRAIVINPNDASCYNNRGGALLELKQTQAAHADFEKAIQLRPNYADAHNNHGLALWEIGQSEAALASYDKAIQFKPDYSDAYNNRGIALLGLKQLKAALESCDKAIQLKPEDANAHNNRGNALLELEQPIAALSSYDKAIQLKPDYVDAYNNRGLVLLGLKQPAEALASFKKAIQLKPDYAQIHCNQGNALVELRDFEAAHISYAKAIELEPDYANTYLASGILLGNLNRSEAAVAHYDKAIQLKPDYAHAYFARGTAFEALKQLDAALASYKLAFELQPDLAYLYGTLCHTKMRLCDWQNFDDLLDNLSEKTKYGQRISPSFPIIALSDSLTTHYQSASIWSKDKYPLNPALGPISKSAPKDKVRIGYFSADFYSHATAFLMAELFERHDKSKFEVIGFSFGPAVQDAMRQRLEAAFSQFIDVRLQSDKDVAQLSRIMGIDIAIDLKGYTGDSRPGIFSYRASPIQISYLGYPGTMATEYIDYLIADPTLVPVESQKHYSEKIIYLPDSYQVNDRQRTIADTVYTRDALGLPQEGFVFCCFNNNYKITPPTFDGWMRILHAVPGSVLWLLEDNATAAVNLRKEAQARGIDPQRLVFAKRMDLPEHLARHRAADLFIDTLPYNAHTTASDALWAGLPVLTCMGQSFASRVAGSLLNAIGMPELVTTTQADYEALAIDLALNPAKIADLKAKLEKKRLTTPLFDTPRFTKHIEAAYAQVYQRYRDDLPPEHVYVDRVEAAVEATESSDKTEKLLQQGFALHQQSKLSEARSMYEAVLRINAKHFDALNMIGAVEFQLGKLDAAVDFISRAIAINPNNASCYNNRGGALLGLKRPEAALVDLNKAIQLDPDYSDAHNNHGLALWNLAHSESALASYKRAIQINPNYSDAYFNQANALSELKQLNAAVVSYDKVIQFKSHHAGAYFNRGNALRGLKQLDAALASYKLAFELQPDLAYLYGTLCHTKMRLCDWQNFDDLQDILSEKTKYGQRISHSFPIIALSDSLTTHYQSASIWSKDKYPLNPALGPISKSVSNDKIRIGYYSADFYNHATAVLIADLFERHDKSKFEVIGLSFGPSVQDAMRQRLEAAFSQFIDVRLQSDKDVAQLSRTMGIDIAIDLKGYTTDSRPGIFSYRAAPIQISYLGYPGTMAAEYIDYLIADPTLVPVESQKHYSEKIIYLPDSYQVNDRQRAIADTFYSRDALGLPPEGFVFCCFNNNYKITPPTFDGWMRILHAVPGSVLWLLEDYATAAVNLRKEAQARGVDPQRLVFAKRMGLPEHLARHRAADLFIDTLPYNAHTTASDALWAGLPVLTCMGESFASRVAGSLLNAVGLSELVTTTQADYEALAIDLALNPAKIADLKAKLEKNRLTTPLFDTPRFTKHLEAAYAQVYRRYRDDLSPEHVYVKSGTELMKYSIVQDDGKKEVQHNSMPERVMYACCPLCESANIGELTIGDCSKHPLYNPKINPKMHWKKCSDCLHVFTNGFFTEEICEIVFGSSHKNQVVGNQIEQSRAVSARMIEKVLPFASEGIWLDVGFGNASLLFTAQEFGFRPVGIDLQKENVHALRALNVESHCVDLSELKLNEACSVISMADVLEHMPFPKDGLVSANKLLAKGGVLLVSMPNTENIVWSSLTASNSNPYWGELEHYHNFSRTRLYQLLDEHGFKVMRYGISERYRVCMEVVAVKIREIHKDLAGSGKN